MVNNTVALYEVLSSIDFPRISFKLRSIPFTHYNKPSSEWLLVTNWKVGISIGLSSNKMTFINGSGKWLPDVSHLCCNCIFMSYWLVWHPSHQIVSILKTFLSLFLKSTFCWNTFSQLLFLLNSNIKCSKTPIHFQIFFKVIIMKIYTHLLSRCCKTPWNCENKDSQHSEKMSAVYIIKEVQPRCVTEDMIIPLSVVQPTGQSCTSTTNMTAFKPDVIDNDTH